MCVFVCQYIETTAERKEKEKKHSDTKKGRKKNFKSLRYNNVCKREKVKSFSKRMGVVRPFSLRAYRKKKVRLQLAVMQRNFFFFHAAAAWHMQHLTILRCGGLLECRHGLLLFDHNRPARLR